MIVLPDRNELLYSGRIDFTDMAAPEFVFPCSYVRITFQGSSLKVRITNKKDYFDSYLGYILDNVQGKLKLEDHGLETTYTIMEGMEDGIHQLTLFKRMDSCHSFLFHGFELEAGARVFSKEPLKGMKLEFYGDSVSAGELSEALDYVGLADPEHNGEYSNSYYSFPWITARKLDAEVHDIAQGGIALLNRTGWFHGPEFMGMEYVYDKIAYNPSLGNASSWDFKRYTPDVVVIAIGQNDANPDNYMAEDPHGEKALAWKKAYIKFVQTIRSIHGYSWIILCTTLLEHHENWDVAIGEACREMKDERIRHLVYKRNGRGTPGHLRIPEAEEMAEELTAFILHLTERKQYDT